MIALAAAWVGSRMAPRLAGLLPYLAAFGLGIAVIGGTYQTGVRAERRAGEAASLRAQLAAASADLTAARQAASSAAADSGRETQRTVRQQELIRDYEKRLAAVPACRLDRAGAARVRQLAR